MNGCIYKTKTGICEKFTDEKVWSWCVDGPCEYARRPSNADGIRAMTDEELAVWFEDMHDSVTCPNGGAIDCNPSCKQCWLDWLKQEVDDG